MKKNIKLSSEQKEKTNYIIDDQGSLGLLAIGYKGLRAWRKVRKEQVKSNSKNNK